MPQTQVREWESCFLLLTAPVSDPHTLPRLHCYIEHWTGMAGWRTGRTRDNGLPQPGRHSKPQLYQTLSNLSPWDGCVSPAPTCPDQTHTADLWERPRVQVRGCYDKRQHHGGSRWNVNLNGHCSICMWWMLKLKNIRMQKLGEQNLIAQHVT